ncbi:MAG: fatty acid desaturase [Planctomycetes bacterium]|nr:fatty acid desaturase [Planctomycetota bacterium]
MSALSPSQATPNDGTRRRGLIRAWLDSTSDPGEGNGDRVDWPRILPFVAIHFGALTALWVGVSWAAAALCVAAYAIRMFGITAFYHRYFAHRAFRTSRLVQFLGALLGNAAGQRGPLWWAAHHRKHHKHADTPLDLHSTEQHGFLWCHAGWWTTKRAFRTDLAQIRDLAKFPELRWLDRFDWIAPVAFAALMFGVGATLGAVWPSLGIDGWQGLVWGFFVSTVLLYHATFTINSLCHKFGSRRYATKDRSRNNAWLAVLTLGEGWHNNHHHYPVAARQGFFWWEFDPTYYGLFLLAKLGVVSELRPVPERVLDDAPGPRRAA